ncbi:hypothetical protein SARC_00382 [Sphaeroforma arctica JP610]|uniref:RRM domain-containing protein n=1 Tax=Sphaeroforma arctica JP610 TaxID=667725 RepID=A0A0L0GF52_9EUKA|nr:hypothetical protein SARC_00382 [Sphaeroforma arctica JP610]KNC87496.1 hypothetical protein SARC_00382 [Sphaeroforma arctica JP610]|eukprot:XP_014161398.1 hypothetical protein SARC_00382 [Sphaeroforma arctica JP610]
MQGPGNGAGMGQPPLGMPGGMRVPLPPGGVMSAIPMGNIRAGMPGLDADNVRQGVIFVGGLPSKITEGDLATFFSNWGHVVETKIIADRETGKPKGYGFVTFADHSVAVSLKQQGSVTYQGRPMNIGNAGVRLAGEGAEAAMRMDAAIAKERAFQPFMEVCVWNRTAVGIV